MIPAIAFIEFGGLAFWFFLAAPAILILCLMENDKHGGAFVTLVAAVFLFAFCLEGFSLFKWVEENPGLAAQRVAGYLGLGMAWSTAKWWFFTRKIRRQWDRHRQEHPHESDIERLIDSFSRGSLRYKAYPLKISDHAARAVDWMIYWPVSCFWTLLNDPIRRFAKWVFRTFMVGLFQKIADSSVPEELRGK